MLVGPGAQWVAVSGIIIILINVVYRDLLAYL